MRQQRYGSQVGERRIFWGGIMWRLSEGPSKNRERNSMSLGSWNAECHQFVPRSSDGRKRLETIDTRAIPAPS